MSNINKTYKKYTPRYFYFNISSIIKIRKERMRMNKNMYHNNHLRKCFHRQNQNILINLKLLD
jgi:hypothetical protein